MKGVQGPWSWKLRGCLPGRRPPCFLTWWSELSGLIVFQGTWIMSPDHRKLAAINAKLVPKGLCSLVDMARKAHRGMGSHSTRLTEGPLC